MKIILVLSLLLTVSAVADVEYYTTGNPPSGSSTNKYDVTETGNTEAYPTFDFGAGEVQSYTQNVTVSNTFFSVPDSNAVWEMTALINWNAGAVWSWGTNKFEFIGGEIPVLISNAWNTVFMLYDPKSTNVTVGVLQ